jgi:hypothetical protein
MPALPFRADEAAQRGYPVMNVSVHGQRNPRVQQQRAEHMALHVRVRQVCW